MPPCFSRLSFTRARNCSTFQPAFATPRTGTSRWPRFAIACSAGKIFLYARSPVAPKNTRASEGLVLIAALRLFRRRLFDVAAELVAHGREQLVGEVRLAARAEALVER